MSEKYKCAGAAKRCRKIECRHAVPHEKDEQEPCGVWLWCDYADQKVRCVKEAKRD